MPGGFPLRLGTAVAVAMALAAVLAPGAGAAGLSVHAASGDRVSVRLLGHVTPGAYDVVLDGRRAKRTRQRSFMLAVPRRATQARWRSLVVRRAGARRVLASARFAVGGANSRRAPTLVLLAAPPATTTSTSAVLRFSASAPATACRLDASAWKRCANPASYRGLAPGQHAFGIRASDRHGSSTLTVTSTVAGTPPASTPSTAPPAGGSTAPPPAAVAGRSLVFDDEFDGTALNTTSWSRYNSVGNAGNGLRRPEAISLDGNGHLVITAQMVNGQLVSGGMSNRLNLTYGYFEFRVRTDPDPTGTMSGVVLTRPQSDNSPIDGENDMYETGADVNTRNPFHSYVHYGANNSQYYFAHNADGAQWHTIGMAWSPTAIDIYRDGTLVWTVSDPVAIPDVAHHICVQLDARFTHTLTTPVTMDVDYVRIYA
jgi:hypothetical protein